MLFSGAPALTSSPPPSTKIRLEKSTWASRVSVCVVFAHSRSARPEATICKRSVTEPGCQFTFSSASPSVCATCAITRLHSSIE